MGQMLHATFRTTEAICREIRNSEKRIAKSIIKNIYFGNKKIKLADGELKDISKTTFNLLDIML